ncbi:MAG: cbb3-type cytochrome c oxidase subunit I [candidate division Zixibacteria bacterium]|nr:cbb3-type cytochrome c oxidase subunit I [candidate division Zixibacteria bacterium]
MIQSIVKRLTSTDHVSVGWLYAATIALFALAGTALGLTLVIVTVKPTLLFLNPAMYARFFTLHGNIMINLLILPVFAGVFGNLILPRVIGSSRVALPRTNLIGWWLYLAGGLLMLVGLWVGVYDGGWTLHTPLKGMSSPAFITLMSGLLLLAGSLFLASLNVALTIYRRRKAGTGWAGLSLVGWTLFLAALVHLIIMPERFLFLLTQLVGHFGADGWIKQATSPDSQVFQHLFWVSSSPAVTIVILPAIGLISELLATFTGKKLFARQGVLIACCVFAGLSLVVWGEHLLIGEQATRTSVLFSFLSALQGIPAGFVLLAWLATMFRGSITPHAPFWYAFAAVALWVMGGLAGVTMSIMSMNVQLHSTAFVVGHTHITIAGSVLLAIFGGLYYWWPLITGSMVNERAAKVALSVSAVGILLTFIPYFVLGVKGVPRRLSVYPSQFQPEHYWAAAGGVVLVCGVLFLVWNLVTSRKTLAAEPVNPWSSDAPEWTGQTG